MADPFGDDGTAQGGAGKRPAQTIEGTATEVSVEAPADAEAAAEAAPGEHEEAAEADEASAYKSEDEQQASEPVEAREEPEPAELRGPPPASTISEMKSFVTHLAAGLLGGLMGVIALAFAWHLIPGGKSDSTAEIAKIEKRIAKLESAPAPAPDTEALAKLEDRVKALEGQTPPDISGLTDRVAQLESAMKALAEAAKNGGSVTDAAAITEQITQAEQRIQANLDKALADAATANAATLKSMQGEIDELKAKIGALAEAGLGGESPDLTALTDRVAKLEAAVDKSAAGTKLAAAVIAFANLKTAVADGRPFAVELDTLASFAPDLDDLGIPAGYAEKGIPTVPELTRSFAASRDAALAAASPAPSGSFFDRLLASASTLIKIKRVDEAATGDTPSAVLARAEALLDKGDLAGAVREVETLQGAPRDAFATWLDQAHARLAANDIMQRLEASLLASVGAPSPKTQD